MLPIVRYNSIEFFYKLLTLYIHSVFSKIQPYKILVLLDISNSYCMANCALAYLLLKFARARSARVASAIHTWPYNNLLVVGA